MLKVLLNPVQRGMNKMHITTHSMGNGRAGIFAGRAVRVLRKRYRIDEIADAKGIEEIHFEVLDFFAGSHSVSVYLNGKYYNFKKLEWLKYRLPRKEKSKTLWQKMTEAYTQVRALFGLESEGE